MRIDNITYYNIWVQYMVNRRTIRHKQTIQQLCHVFIPFATRSSNASLVISGEYSRINITYIPSQFISHAHTHTHSITKFVYDIKASKCTPQMYTEFFFLNTFICVLLYKCLHIDSTHAHKTTRLYYKST